MPLEPDQLRQIVERVCRKIAPLWPLEHFVAVNPFLGFRNQSFAVTCHELRRVTGVEMLMPRSFYCQALTDGLIEEPDLQTARRALPDLAHRSQSVAELRQVLARAPFRRTPHSRAVTTVADVLDELAAGNRQRSRTAYMIDEISKWCAAYFDRGQSLWRMPTRHEAPYAAWRALACFDLTPETLGIAGFRQTIASLSEDPFEAIGQVIGELGLPEAAVEDYLYRALFEIKGWAAHARYRVWHNDSHGGEVDVIVEILAIRIAWGYALFHERSDDLFRKAWRTAIEEAAPAPASPAHDTDNEFDLDLLLQEAYEAAFRRRFFARIGAANQSASSRLSKIRPVLQAAFCIDVRSEVYRRALESVCPHVETIGVAGFFGLPLEYLPFGQTRGESRCPVLLKPTLVAQETLSGVSDQAKQQALRLRVARHRVAQAWKSFKASAVSCFAYVETFGLLFALKIIGDSTAPNRAAARRSGAGLSSKTASRTGPTLAPCAMEERVLMAHTLLRAMSLTEDFARLVLLVGHGSSTVNNPYASSLDCGACGGHSGDVNARLAAAILNEPPVRVRLRERGVHIPDETWFMGALHDTTTDDLLLYETSEMPISRADDLKGLRAWLDKASTIARAERSAKLGMMDSTGRAEQFLARSRDWSQVRPEWGLAGNAVFIAAPRERTRGLNLEGRAFLHDYDWRKDRGFAVLELIMTAPLVVASWINLQYYGSTVNNRVFGSGNKTLHNVVGLLGVLEGNAGDLRVGLPWQSVHDGKRFIHEPLRLHALIEAPEAEIDAVIAKHESVRELVENRWIHVLSMNENGKTLWRHRAGHWELAA